MHKPYFKIAPIHFAHTPGASWAMRDLCVAYQYPTGLGTRAAKIAIIELGGGFRSSDIQAAFAKWGMPTPTITIGSGNNQPGGDADGEVVLDIEVAAACATFCTGKAAQIGMFFGDNTDQGFYNAWAAAIAANPDAISCSWGGPESGWSRTTMANFVALHGTAKCPQTAASGDNNSGDGLSGSHVDFPASSPYVIGCGGTWKPAVGEEKVWNDGPSNGTGGGYSAIYPPQQFQVGVAPGTGRLVPDLAAVASPATGYQIFLDGQWQVIGGTSAVAPLIAGLLASYGVEFEKRGLPPLGWCTDRLYRHPAAFNDIVTGTNGQWRASSGIDPCTGLGVPNGTELLKQLIGMVAAPPPPVIPPPVVVPPPIGPPPAKRPLSLLEQLVQHEFKREGYTVNTPSKTGDDWSVFKKA